MYIIIGYHNFKIIISPLKMKQTGSLLLVLSAVSTAATVTQ